MLKLLKFLLLISVLTSCVDQMPERDFSNKNKINGDGSIGGGTNGNGQGAGTGSGGIGSGVDDIDPKVEIRHFIDPVDGSYTRKLTIPKNFQDMLYISGLNVGTLHGKFIKVKFKFGMYHEVIELPAGIGRGQGINPQTDIQVLILDLRNKPFNNLRLSYDLYDYNEYDFDARDEDTGEFVNEDPTSEPATNNRNTGLYCRGLKLEDDHTFLGTGIGVGCDTAGAECLYSYAKLKDRGLLSSSGSTMIPSLAQIDSEALGYFSDDSLFLLNRCLPDTPRYDDTGAYDPANVFFKLSESIIFDALGDDGMQGVYEDDFTYIGPYAPLNEGIWEIGVDAVIGSKGLFLDTLDEDDPQRYGASALLFPRYIKRDLIGGVEHLSSSRPNGFKDVIPFPNNGSTEWMDGCNERVSTLNNFTNEHVGSCNVSATIEIWAKTPGDDQYELVAGKNDGGKEVKLQLVRPAVLNVSGEDVLSSNLRSCANSSMCGASECCFNNRCWSRDIVSQCKEDLEGQGNFLVGQNCTSDLQCSTLCCNQSEGRCQVHSNSSVPPILCSKPSGQSCIAKEWCVKETVRECFIIKTGSNSVGESTCELRCYNRLKHGDCRNGTCTPPEPPQDPVFNPADPNRCDQAIDPPSE
jgi:hypothetical protein